MHRDFLPIDAHEVLVLDLQWLVLYQLLDHVGQLPTAPALLEIRLVEFGDRLVVVVVDHLELLLSVGVEVDQGLFSHAEPRGFSFLVGLRHQDVFLEWFVQVGVVGEVLG